MEATEGYSLKEILHKGQPVHRAMQINAQIWHWEDAQHIGGASHHSRVLQSFTSALPVWRLA